MGESHRQRHAGGEIVQVQGGHIVRSTGRKDRHSKVCTAKGPRDRRVRLSAHTAIQFYDVQDRLGYDRPSKAVDWLIKKAKSAIDELAELPSWTPTASTANTNPASGSTRTHDDNAFAGRSTAAGGFEQEQMNHHSAASFLPPSLDSDAIADTIKSFFPMGDSAEAPPSSIQLQHYPPDLLSRTCSHSQDLRLSLHPFHDPVIPSHHSHEQSLFSVGFDGFQRMMGWNDGGGEGFFSSPQPPLFGQTPNQFFSSQRGPLQSSNTPSVRAWTDPYPQTLQHQPEISGMGFGPYGGFSGFHIPARIQGEEEHDGIHNKPSSASSDSCH